MKAPFSIIIIPGDGARVVRLSLPRWKVYGAAGVLASSLGAMVGVSGESLRLMQEAAARPAIRQQVDDSADANDAFRARIAAIRSELATWKELHERMWDAFAPVLGVHAMPARGGDEAPAPDVAGAGVLGREVALLAGSVAEERPRLRELEGVVSRTEQVLHALPLRWPVRGQVNSEFGLRRSPWTHRPEHHPGIDIASPPGTPVTSPAEGTVITASVVGGFGKKIILDHGNGVESVYGHLKKVDVKVGERVKAGQVIGLVGNTGRSTGPHLHYGVLVEGKPVNPREFLRQVRN